MSFNKRKRLLQRFKVDPVIKTDAAFHNSLDLCVIKVLQDLKQKLDEYFFFVKTKDQGFLVPYFQRKSEGKINGQEVATLKVDPVVKIVIFVSV